VDRTVYHREKPVVFYIERCLPKCNGEVENGTSGKAGESGEINISNNITAEI
jgi:hypothetical protein